MPRLDKSQQASQPVALRERDRFVLRARTLARKASYWDTIDDERARWNRRNPTFKIFVTRSRGRVLVGEPKRPPVRPGPRDPAPRELEDAFDSFLRRGGSLRSKMGPQLSEEFAGLYPALNEWGLRVELLLAKFFPVEDLFEARQPPGPSLFFDDHSPRHPAGAFIAGSLLWGKRLVSDRELVDPERVRLWIRPAQPRGIYLSYDPRGTSPSEADARAHIAVMSHEIGKALRAGGLDEDTFVAIWQAASVAGRKAAIQQRSAHPRWLAVPLDADLRRLSSYLRNERERVIALRIERLHKAGATANAIAERLGLDPQTVRRKLLKR